MQNKIKQRISMFKLSKKELKKIKGGFCGCGCFYEDCGGSSSADNAAANTASALMSIPPVDTTSTC